MQLVLITRDVNVGVHSSHVWLWCACIIACILACVGLVGFKFEVRMMNAVWKTLQVHAVIMLRILVQSF